MNVEAKIDQADQDRLQQLLTRIGKETKQDIAGVLKQAAIWSLQSAAKATEPGKSAFKSIPAKYKFRPLVTTQEYEGGRFWYLRKKSGKLFSVHRPLKRGKEMKGVKRAKAIKVWSKKKNAFVMRPTHHTKRDKTDKAFRIPYAGAAKAGWQKALAAFGEVTKVDENRLSGYYYDRKTGQSKKRKSKKPYYKKAGTTYDFYIQNLVKYTAKTSPFSAKVAMLKTIRRLEGYWLKRLDGKLQKRSK